MHFAKTYTQLLLTLPPELRNNVFEYRKLKKLINQTVFELESLGLGPSVLQSLHEHGNPGDGLAHFEEQETLSALTVDPRCVPDGSTRRIIIYEIASNSSSLEPRLRLSLHRCSPDAEHTPSTAQPTYHIDLPIPESSLLHVVRALHSPVMPEDEMPLVDNSDSYPDVVIPLPSDAAFFDLLTSTLSSLSDHSDTLHDDFRSTLAMLATSISSTARPASSSAPRSFSAYSLGAHNPRSVHISLGGKSDLYPWREIFRLYIEAEVFESVSRSTRGERSIEEVAERLKLFEKHVQEKASLTLPRSRECLDVFLSLNLFILDLRKFELANSEATRKILKKHAKRTTFPIPSYLLDRDAAPITRPWKPLPKLLVQAIGEVLLPIVPHIDDCLCLICTSIAFKPIRLRCGHFFCVRCLVKMQRRGMANCPLCRAPTVLQANPSNIDYGLLNFIADWFPIESREKLHADDREVTQEQMEELSISGASSCRIM